MIAWLIDVNKKCRTIAAKAQDCLTALDEDNTDAAKRIQGYMKDDYQALVQTWEQVNPDKKKSGRLGDLSRHIKFGDKQDYIDIIKHDLPDVLERAELLAMEGATQEAPVGFDGLLHPKIVQYALPHFQSGHLREAVLNAVIALFDMIRTRTGLDLDGKDLVGQAFGQDKGILAFSDLNTESGKNDHIGFMQIVQGVYTGVRNPKAHSLIHDLNEQKAAQYLVMLSLLARRVDECYVR